MVEKKQVPIFFVKTGKIILVDKIIRSDDEWKKLLTPQQYKVTREKYTETPFTCPLNTNKNEGLYQCVCCDTDLFVSKSKFDSGTGWPSFWEPVASQNLIIKEDRSLGMMRSEVLCSRCDAHLGHVFSDGPRPSGKRYCINGVALKFIPMRESSEKAMFGAGCFWGVEEEFRQLKGVVVTKVGYSGGNFKNPTYEDVCSGKTGHAEVVQIEYNPDTISYDKLLDVFWDSHDPTTINRQGLDTGSQYRSIIFFYTPQQEVLAKAKKEQLIKMKRYKQPIVTEIVPAQVFYMAEDYHQKYYQKRGVNTCRIK